MRGVWSYCAVLVTLVTATVTVADGAVKSPHVQSIGCHNYSLPGGGGRLERCQGLYTMQRTWAEAAALCKRDAWTGLAIADNAQVALGIIQRDAETHTRLMALLVGRAGTGKEKPIWILLKQETVSGSGIRWAIRKSAPRSRQIPQQHPTAQFFTGRMPLMPPNQQRQALKAIT